VADNTKTRAAAPQTVHRWLKGTAMVLLVPALAGIQEAPPIPKNKATPFQLSSSDTIRASVMGTSPHYTARSVRKASASLSASSRFFSRSWSCSSPVTRPTI
jgi:hypothetical protein